MWEPGENNIIFSAGTEVTFLQQNQSLRSPRLPFASSSVILPKPASLRSALWQPRWHSSSSSKTSAECDLTDPTLSPLNVCFLLLWDPMYFWFCLVPFPRSASSICILVCPRNCFISPRGPCPRQSGPFYGGNHYSMLWTPNPTPLVLTFLTNCRPEANCRYDISQTLCISNWSHNISPKPTVPPLDN